MSLVGKQINDAMAVRLWGEITFHTYRFGGTTVEIYGSKGSTKTTLMLKIASKLRCESPDGAVPEPAIWRGRTVDQWNWYPRLSDIKVFVHKADDVVFYDETGQEIEVRVTRYRNAEDLMQKLGRFNVVYEPRSYSLSEELVDLLAKRSTLPKRLMKDIAVDSSIWWFEFVHYLLERPDNKFISLFIDEADEVFPENPSGLRWHLQLWLKDNVKDLRKRNVSLYFSAHSHTDIDSRIRTKMQYRILMKGARVPQGSLIDKKDPLFLKPGQAYIERDGYGKFSFDPLQERPKIVVRFLS
ncbi:hypothetical protein [Archaeoglobus sp.]